MNFNLGSYRDPLARTAEAGLLRSQRDSAGLWLYPQDSCFFPEAGGQPGDRGWIRYNCNGAELTFPVRDTQLKAGDLALLLPAEAEDPPPGTSLYMELDWERRWAFMCLHSAEHMVSGYVRRRWGYDNVGFALSEELRATADFNGLLSEEDCREIELEIQKEIWARRPVRAWIPSAEELAKVDFRQKKELRGPLRLVQVEGCDCCACCALHCTDTGAIGALAIVRLERQRRGTRLHLQVGAQALSQWQEATRLQLELSRRFSLPRDRVLEGVEQIQTSLGLEREQRRRFIQALARTQALASAEQPRSQILAQLLRGLGKGDGQLYAQTLASALGRPIFLLELQAEMLAFYLAGVEGDEARLAEFMQMGKEGLGLLGGGRACYYQGKCGAADALLLEGAEAPAQIRKELGLDLAWLPDLELS